MTASGPFAMGPTLAGTSARRTAPRSNFAPIVPQGPGGTAHLGAGLTLTTAPSLKRERGREPAPADDDVEAYSDPDEGVEIVDMDHIKQMDWMAPESLGKEKEGGKRKKGLKVKEDPDKQEDRKGKGRLFSQQTSRARFIAHSIIRCRKGGGHRGGHHA